MTIRACEWEHASGCVFVCMCACTCFSAPQFYKPCFYCSKINKDFTYLLYFTLRVCVCVCVCMCVCVRARAYACPCASMCVYEYDCHILQIMSIKKDLCIQLRCLYNLLSSIMLISAKV